MKYLMILVLILSSCATLFSSSSDTITLKSDPKGATVRLDGVVIGKTPLTYSVKREAFSRPKVQITKKGYKAHSYELGKTLNSVAILNLSSMFSWGTDFITGKAIRYSPTNYYSELERKGRAEIKNKLHGEVSRFVIVNHRALLEDIIKGSGEYLETYSELKEVDTKKINKAFATNKPELILVQDSVDFYRLTQKLTAQL